MCVAPARPLVSILHVGRTRYARIDSTTEDASRPGGTERFFQRLGSADMEGIGAAEGVLIHRRELREALITEQSYKRRRVPGRRWLSPRATDLSRLIARWLQSMPATRAGSTSDELHMHDKTLLSQNCATS
jgi:hypothetical protein